MQHQQQQQQEEEDESWCRGLVVGGTGVLLVFVRLLLAARRVGFSLLTWPLSRCLLTQQYHFNGKSDQAGGEAERGNDVAARPVTTR